MTALRHRSARARLQVRVDVQHVGGAERSALERVEELRVVAGDRAVVALVQLTRRRESFDDVTVCHLVMAWQCDIDPAQPAQVEQAHRADPLRDESDAARRIHIAQPRRSPEPHLASRRLGTRRPIRAAALADEARET